MAFYVHINGNNGHYDETIEEEEEEEKYIFVLQTIKCYVEYLCNLESADLNVYLLETIASKSHTQSSWYETRTEHIFSKWLAI